MILNVGEMFVVAVVVAVVVDTDGIVLESKDQKSFQKMVYPGGCSHQH